MPGRGFRVPFGMVAAVCIFALLETGGARAQESAFKEDKAVDVEVKIVPFYAVDADGRPVYDLKAEEVEVLVGGVPVALQSFDRYAAHSSGDGAAAGPASSTPRNVFLIFDVVFALPSGFNTAQRLAADLVESWPGADRLHLMVNASNTGLVRRLGPVPADAAGKRSVVAEIKDLKPEVRRLHLGLDHDFGPTVGSIRGSDKDSRPNSQMSHNYDTLRGNARGEYHSAAQDFADSLETFASDLRRLSGPKLLVIFSQGLSPDLYFDGDTGNKMGSDETIRVNSRRAPPLVERFKGPLEALSDAGALALFVNPTQASGVDNTLLHMAKTNGGLYLDGTDRRGIERRITSSTAAYYEAGFQPAGALLASTRAEVTVAVRRPGVRVWAPPAVKTRETYQGLSAQERKLLVVDLISGGPEAQRARSAVRLDTRDLAGRPVGGGGAGRRLLRFDIDWPAELGSRKFDLYTVVLAHSGKGEPAAIVQFDQQEGVAASDFGALENAFEGGDDYLWGIVAIDPETDRAWFRRLRIQTESAKK